MKSPLFTIILPTFNESQNVMPILCAIKTELSNYTNEYEILFVDDSDDDTPQKIALAKSEYPNIRLLHRAKADRTGLGTAFVDGFKHAQGKFIVCMDSDLQHPPSAISSMIAPLFGNCADMVVGSRYMRGGSTIGLSNLYRQSVSRATRFFVWFLLPSTRKTSDPPSGFFAFRKSIVNEVNFAGLRGYKILVDMLVRLRKVRVSEVPIIFGERENGVSKSNLKQGIEFLKHVLTLWYVFIWRPKKILKSSFITGVVFFGYYLVFLSANSFLEISVATVAYILILQGIFALYLMMYAWDNPERARLDSSPEIFIQPKNSFTALLPVRHETNVVRHTINALSAIEYPEHLKEVIVICSDDDAETILAVKNTIKDIGSPNIRLAMYSEKPINKPHALNVGLKHAKNDVVVIFDAEDEPHKDIYSIVNTVMLRDNADIVQSGVQLMNYRTKWFTMFNVMEYYFWFKSSLHFFAQKGAIPLGGNTVFFKRNLLNQLDGWDTSALTEDADIGIRASILGANIRVIYDAKHATQEETPPDIKGFIKQRTRWNHGFYQILFKMEWIRLPRISQKILSGYIFLWPLTQTLLFLYLPISIIIALMDKVPAHIAILANIPLYILILHFVTYVICLYLFTKDYKLKFPWYFPIKALIFYIPYQILLGFSALRAFIRLLQGNLTWEKTTHINAHRNQKQNEPNTTFQTSLMVRKKPNPKIA